MKLSVIIPAFNEETCLKETIENTIDYLENSRTVDEFEIIAVNDGSTDATKKIIAKINHPGFKAINLEKNSGKGSAVKEGIRLTKGEIKLFMDADNSTKINEIDEFLKLISQGYDIVIASRAVKGAIIEEIQPFWKVALGKLGNRMIRLFTGLPYMDTQCGFKLFTAKAADLFDSLDNLRWAFDVEILLKAKRAGLKVYEAPVHWTNDRDSKFYFKEYPKFFIDLLKIRFKK